MDEAKIISKIHCELLQSPPLYILIRFGNVVLDIHSKLGLENFKIHETLYISILVEKQIFNDENALSYHGLIKTQMVKNPFSN